VKPLFYVPTVRVLYEFAHFLQGPGQMQVFMLITVGITTVRSPVLVR